MPQHFTTNCSALQAETKCKEANTAFYRWPAFLCTLVGCDLNHPSRCFDLNAADYYVKHFYFFKPAIHAAGFVNRLPQIVREIQLPITDVDTLLFKETIICHSALSKCVGDIYGKSDSSVQYMQYRVVLGSYRKVMVLLCCWITFNNIIKMIDGWSKWPWVDEMLCLMRVVINSSSHCSQRSAPFICDCKRDSQTCVAASTFAPALMSILTTSVQSSISASHKGVLPSCNPHKVPIISSNWLVIVELYVHLLNEI